MSIIQFLADLAKKDIKLWLEGENLRFSAPEGAFTPEVKDSIVSRKPEIIEFLKSAQQSKEERIPTVNRQGALPLSYAQQRMWVLQQLDPQSCAYNMPIVLRLRGALAVEQLRAAFLAMAQRHEVLRTRFTEEAGEPVQQIDAIEQWPLPIADISDRSPTQQQALIKEKIQQELNTPFNLQTGPVFRTQLVVCEETEQGGDYILLATMHHIISDGWSMGVIVKELGAFYAAAVAGIEAPLPELPIQYVDFAAWQKEWLSGERLDKQIDFWKDQLQGVELLELPTDFPRPAERTTAGATLEFEIAVATKNRLNELCRQFDVTPFMFLLSVYYLFLNKYSGQTDLCVGSPIANRNRSELEGLIGFFVNTLAFRTELDPQQSFDALLKQVQSMALAAYEEQDVPFEKLVEALNVPRDMSHTPIFQTLFVLQNNPDLGGQTEQALTIDPVEMEGSTAKFDLSLALAETSQEIQASLEYSTDLFSAGTAQRMADHFVGLLESVLANPKAKLTDLSVLSASEREALLAPVVQPNANNYQSELSLSDIFQAQVENTPDAIALVYEGEQLTYTQLNQRANQLAGHLLTQEITTNSLIGICMDRSVDMIVALLAVLKTGAGYLPLDPTNPEDRLSFILSDALSKQQTKLVLVHAATADRLPAGDYQIKNISELNADLEKLSTDNPPALADHADDWAYVIYTSGTTGKPKGVLIPHRNVTRLFAATDEWFQFTNAPVEQDVWTLFHSFAFDFSVWEIWGPLLHGGKLVVVPYHISRSPEDTHQLLLDEGVTILNQTPSAFTQLIHVDSQQSEQNRRKLQLREVIFGGEALDFAALVEWQKHHSLDAPRLINMYGITETTVHVTYYPITQQDLTQRASVIGVPIPDLVTVVLDQSLNPVPNGVAGELYVGGAGLANGYLHRPELTAERFIENPFGGPTKLYKTGDLVKLSTSGQLEYLGRIDDQVKIRGFRIELGEIESALQQLPEIKDCVVIAREDTPGDKRLVGYAATDNTEADIQALKESLRQYLPEYMVPTALVLLNELPLTANGKVDKKALPAPQLATNLSSAYLAPRSAVEEGLAQIWQEVLELERVGVRDNFFDLGGHSIVATKVVSRVREQLQVELPLKTLFKSPTIAGIAEWIESSDALNLQPLAAVDRDGPLPLSFAQQRLWILDQLEPNSSAYNMPGAVRIKGHLDLVVVEKALDAIVERHEALRTTFTSDGDEVFQVIHDHQSAQLKVQDLSGLSDAERTATLERIMKQEIDAPYSLTEGPLFRAQIIQLAEQEFILAIAMHHIISDGWSVGVFVNEFVTLYEGFKNGVEQPLPALPLQYADFSVWQRQLLQGKLLEEQVAYWKEQLDPDDFVLDLPTDKPRHAQTNVEAGMETLQITDELLQRFNDLSKQEGATLFMSLLSAFGLLLYRYTAQTGINIGTPIAGRNRAEIENLIGFFINTLVIRVDTDSSPTFRELLGRVKETSLGAFSHQDLPFEKLVEELQPERDLTRTPIFQVFFNLINLPESARRISDLTIESASEEGEVDQHSKFDITLYAKETGDGLQFSLVYNAQLFTQSRIQMMLSHLELLMAQIVDNPDQSIESYRLASKTDGDNAQLPNLEKPLAAQDYPSPVALIETVANDRPNALAIKDPFGSWTYKDLQQVTNKLAQDMRAAGVCEGDRVAIYGPRSASTAVALVAALKAGVSFQLLDPLYPDDRLKLYLEESQPEALLLLGDAVLPDTAKAFVQKSDLKWQGQLDLVAHLNAGLDHVSFDWQAAQAYLKQNSAYLTFTSGTEGKPKAVTTSLLPLCHFLDWYHQEFAITVDERFSMLSGLAHDPIFRDILVPLTAGASLYVPGVEEVLQPGQLKQWMAANAITVSHLTPAMAEVLVLNEGTDVNSTLSSLRLVLLGGDKIPANLLDELNEVVPDAALYNCYGATETPQIMALEKLTNKDQVQVIGFGIDGVDLCVINGAGELAAVGEVGEICIRSPYLASGYLNDKALTAKKFVTNPASESIEDRYYRTGDKGRYLPTGKVAFIGRIDEQVKIRGYRVEPMEVRERILTLPLVRQAAVVAQPDGDGHNQLVAYVVGLVNTAAAKQQVRQHLAESLPDYMLPSAIVLLNSLPLTPNGKLDKHALPALGEQDLLDEEFVAPSSDIELAIAEIWQQVMKKDKISIKSDFFNIGGHSLMATRIVARVKKLYDVDFSLKDLFEVSNIEKMAKYVETMVWLREDNVELVEDDDDREDFEI